MGHVSAERDSLRLVRGTHSGSRKCAAAHPPPALLPVTYVPLLRRFSLNKPSSSIHQGLLLSCCLGCTSGCSPVVNCTVKSDQRTHPVVMQPFPTLLTRPGRQSRYVLLTRT